MIELARKKKLFLMEAMWTRFLPSVIKLRQLLAEGVIGEIRMLTADLGFRTGLNPESRLFDPALGGGALLDVGVYTISWASMLLGQPKRISSMAHIGETGVDEQAAMILGYEQGQLAVLYTAIRTSSPGEGIIMGTEGRITVHSPSLKPPRLTISRPGQADEVLEIPPHEGNGYNYQAAEVMRCLREGHLESETMSLDETLAIMQTMDKIRAQWGLKYPME
jgi:predicted dehydrogenase